MSQAIAGGPHVLHLRPVKTFRHLRSGGYTLFVRAVARDGRRSAAVTHRFTIRS